MATESKVLSSGLRIQMGLTAEQQAQNDYIVDQYRELQKHIHETIGDGRGMGAKKFHVTGHALVMHVNTGIIPHFTIHGYYLSHLRKLLREDWFIYSVSFKEAVTCLKDKGEGKNLLRHENSSCGLDVVGKELYVNILLYKVTLDKLRFEVQRLVSFFHKLAQELDLILTTVVLTCTAIEY